ncbi:hypothetical protein, partial [Klebsiella pneumoniae]|uniref:hypothetical protein n=1 Tax=Klebsiella pneumoniae TaxID=573 RepID=UPI00406CC4FA
CVVRRLRFSGPKTSIICSPMTSLKTSIKTITYLSDIGCLEIQGASLCCILVLLRLSESPKRKGWNEKKHTIGRFWSPDFGYLVPDCFINFSDK